jgi:hypothetical protein
MPGRQPLNRFGTRYVAYPEDGQAKGMRQDRWFELEKEQERQELGRRDPLMESRPGETNDVQP